MKARFSDNGLELFDFTPETIGAVSQDDVVNVVNQQIQATQQPNNELIASLVIAAINNELNTDGSLLNMTIQDIVSRAYKNIDALTRIALGSDATGDLYYRNAAGGLTRVPVGNAGQLLGVNVPGGANPNVPGWVNAPTTINWQEITANATAAINNGYILTLAGGLTLTLPPTAPVGSQVLVLGKSGNWVVKGNTGQTINFLGTVSAAGGTATSQAGNQYMQLIATTADTVWTVGAASGQVDIV